MKELEYIGGFPASLEVWIFLTYGINLGRLVKGEYEYKEKEIKQMLKNYIIYAMKCPKLGIGSYITSLLYQMNFDTLIDFFEKVVNHTIDKTNNL